MTAVTEDSLVGGRVRLRQPRDGYRAAIDPVLLAAAAPVRSGQRVLDIGTGVGAAGLCLLARVPAAEVVGLEVQMANAALAAENRSLNAADLSVVVGDVRRPPFAPHSFDHSIANPPFLAPGTFKASPNGSALRANAETDARLNDWVQLADGALKPRGSFTLIHRADRVDDVVAALHGRFGGITLMPLWPSVGRDAKRIVVQATKGSKTPARLLPGLVLHDAHGQFTPEAEAVLRGGEALSLLSK